MTTRTVLKIALLVFAASCISINVGATDSPKSVVDSVTSEDGLVIHYATQGSSDRALFFVHCWSCDRSYWRNQVDEFSKEYKVVTIDLAGHGESGMNRENWTIAAYGADVAAVVNKVAPKEAILIGHSMGGPVVLEAARRLPGKVTAIIGVDTFQNMAFKPSAEQIEGFVGPLSSNFQPLAMSFVASLFPLKADSALVMEIVNDMSSEPPEVAIPSLRSSLGYDYAAALKEVRVPIRGINSNKMPVNAAENRKLAASYDVEIMLGVGHFPHLENPTEFNKILHKTIYEFWPK